MPLHQHAAAAAPRARGARAGAGARRRAATHARNARNKRCARRCASRVSADAPPAQILLGSSFPIYGASKNVLGGAILLQVVYDWYWNLRLRKSWVSYQRKLKALRADKKKA